MAKHILKCQECGAYTLTEQCKCGGVAVPAKPPKYSPEDPYGDYRRRAKEEYWRSIGLL
ncbi:RNA-protein complex protein Nop10 [Candidatus Woesearchaeota archaeon]|mgnify:CR=1 FL=1|nr:RNA-protein complex protein Nop10 [Candidatus Woesearchaeota archaeon]RLE43730.1 MAG: RNA-protein complex protein Nop10 [Candidatus Woesearchaeota archaeon]